MRLRVGSVPYLNAKPLVDWFHTQECTTNVDGEVEVIYAVPSQLARMLRAGEIDVCNCSIFESMRAPGLRVIPNISISSQGSVKSVRLFCKIPVSQVKTVALDSSSLTSAALTQIILSEVYGIRPNYVHSAPDLDAMLTTCDAGLIIGDLKLFDLHTGTTVYDLGACWQQLTGAPFVYAAWQAPVGTAGRELEELLHTAKMWGLARLDEIAHRWARQMDLPEAQCLDYFVNAMDYDLTPRHVEGMRLFQAKCVSNGLVDTAYPIEIDPTSSP